MCNMNSTGVFKRLHCSSDTYERRSDYFKTNYGFKCHCRACDIPSYDVSLTIYVYIYVKSII